MKQVLFTTIIVLLATSAQASAQDELRNYPQWVQSECKTLTGTRDRVAFRYNYPAAVACARATMDKMRENALIDSQIELNRAETEWLDESKRNLQYNRRNR